MKRTACLMALIGFAHTAHAEEYTLFNPVPDDQVRPMSTERPSKSDSPVTLDAGHFQIETSLLNGIYNDDCIAGTCTKSKEWDAGSFTTLRAGLTQSSEIQLVFDAYRDLTVSDKTVGTRNELSGFGDTLLRYKYNFWGNDGGKTALAGMVFTKLPTNSDNLGNDDVEGGIEFPFSVALDDKWTLGGMTQLNVLKEQGPARDYYLGYVNAAYLSRTLNEKTSAYGEFYTYLPDTGERDWQNTADFGIVHKLTDAVQIDTGVNFGITSAAPDTQWFAGVAYRF